MGWEGLIVFGIPLIIQCSCSMNLGTACTCGHLQCAVHTVLYVSENILAFM